MSSPATIPSMVTEREVEVPKEVVVTDEKAINSKIDELKKRGKLDKFDEVVQNPLTEKQKEIVAAYKKVNEIEDPIAKKKAFISLSKQYPKELGIENAPQTEWDAYKDDVANLDAPGTMATAGAITGAALGAPLMGIGAIPGAAIGGAIGGALGYGSQKIDEIGEWWEKPGIFATEDEKTAWAEKNKDIIEKKKLQGKTGYERAKMKIDTLVNRYSKNQNSLAQKKKHNKDIDDLIKTIKEDEKYKTKKTIKEKKKINALMSPSEFKAKVDLLFAPKVKELKGKSPEYIKSRLKDISQSKKDMMSQFQKEYDKEQLKSIKNAERIQTNKDKAAHELLKSELANKREILKQSLKQNTPQTEEDKLKIKKLRLSIKKLAKQVEKLNNED
jgi:hypothetical protein